MACRLFGDNPLSEPMTIYCQLDSKEQTNFKQTLFDIQKFSFKKMHLKKLSAKMAAMLARSQCVKIP